MEVQNFVLHFFWAGGGGQEVRKNLFGDMMKL